MCGVSRWQMQDWLRAGELPVVRFPKKGNSNSLRGAKLDPADVERFIAQCKTRVGVLD